jgi:hypothetical protein
VCSSDRRVAHTRPQALQRQYRTLPSTSVSGTYRTLIEFLQWSHGGSVTSVEFSAGEDMALFSERYRVLAQPSSALGLFVKPPPLLPPEN